MNFMRKMLNGDMGLAKTFWLHGVLVTLCCQIILKIQGDAVIVSNEAVDKYTLIFLTLVALGYQFLVNIGIWNASKKYQGKHIYAILANIVVLTRYIGIVISLSTLALYSL